MAVPKRRVVELTINFHSIATGSFHRTVRWHAIDRHSDNPLVLQFRDRCLFRWIEWYFQVPIHFARRIRIALYMFMVRDPVAHDYPFPLGLAITAITPYVTKTPQHNGLYGFGAISIGPPDTDG